MRPWVCGGQAPWQDRGSASATSHVSRPVSGSQWPLRPSVPFPWPEQTGVSSSAPARGCPKMCLPQLTHGSHRHEWARTHVHPRAPDSSGRGPLGLGTEGAPSSGFQGPGQIQPASCMQEPTRPLESLQASGLAWLGQPESDSLSLGLRGPPPSRLLPFPTTAGRSLSAPKVKEKVAPPRRPRPAPRPIPAAGAALGRRVSSVSSPAVGSEPGPVHLRVSGTWGGGRRRRQRVPPGR